MLILLTLLSLHPATSSQLIIDTSELTGNSFSTTQQIYISVGPSSGNFSNTNVTLTLGGTNNTSCLNTSSLSTWTVAASGPSTNIIITIICEGTFTLTASSNSSSFTTSSPVSISVYTNVYHITLTTNVGSNPFVDVYGQFIITFGLYGLHGEMWQLPETLNVTSNQATFSCQEKLVNVPYTDYEQTLHCSFETTGVWTVTVSGRMNQTTIWVTVVPLTFQFTSVIPNVTNSSEALSVSVQAYSSDGVTKVTDVGFSIYLAVQCNEDPCSGSMVVGGGSAFKPVTTVWGAYNFTNVHVLSYGSLQMYVYVSGDNQTYGYSNPFFNYNKVKYLNVSINTQSTSTFSSIMTNVNISGEDGGPYYNQTTVYFQEVTQMGRGLLGGNTALTIQANQGGGSGLIYFTNDGTKMIRARVGQFYGDSSVVNVSQNNITISGVNPVPKDTRDAFSFTVYVRNNKGDNLIEGVRIPLTISTSPMSNSIGSQQWTDTHGMAVINNFTIQDGGTFYLVITAGSTTYKSSSNYTIEKIDCNMGPGPITALTVLLCIGLGLSVYFISKDYKVNSFSYTCCRVLTIHPITGLFVPQPNFRRALLCMHIAAGELILLCIIAAFYGHYDTPTTHYTLNFNDFINKELFKGGYAWGLTQVAVIPMFYLNYKAGVDSWYIKIAAAVSLVFIALATAGIIVMSTKYCLGYFVCWIMNFVALFVVDFLFLQVIYSFVCVCFMNRVIKFEMDTKPVKLEDNGNTF